MRHPALSTLAGVATLALAVLGVRRVLADRAAADVEADLFAVSGPLPVFSEADLDDLPEPARRYLRHAVAPGTVLSPAVRLWMDGTMTPTSGGASVALSAVETLAPTRGFVWTARAWMKGLPVRVRDHYTQSVGGVDVALLGLLPLSLADGPAVTRSTRGRLVAEGVWCPTALVRGARWEAVDDDHARYRLSVDGEPVTVTIHVAPDGALREVTLFRWGDTDGKPWRLLPYGFCVDAERTFGGITIPTQLTGGWHYGTDRFGPDAAASFTVHRATFAR